MFKKHLTVLSLAAALLAAVSCGESKLYPTPPGSHKPGNTSTPDTPQEQDQEDELWKMPEKLFADDYFQKFTDPSGVVSYYLKSEAIGKDNSQSIYYIGTEMSNDERFVFALCSTNEWSGEPQEKHGIVIDLKTRKQYTFSGTTGAYPLLDPDEDKLYYVRRTTGNVYPYAYFYRRDLLVDPSAEIKLAPLPQGIMGRILPEGRYNPVWRILNHITLTSDKKKVFIDPKVVDDFYWGLLDLYTGEWEEWGHSTTENVTHGQINPKHDDEALCAIDSWTDQYKVDHKREEAADGTCRRMQLVKKGYMKTIMPSDENGATHEGWTSDGNHVYFCGHGINVRNIRTGEYKRVLLTNLSKEQATHCHPSKDMTYWTFDDAYPDFYRGGRWKVRFLNTRTDKQAYIYTQRPAITSKDNQSSLHPDPHPHFVCNDKYIICTMAGEDLNLHLSITPVDQLIKMTE
ncbi:MAG: hypothetical protein J5835_02900 [Bacteroidales bacterium]|nr:hypothetical protein [Bacteroidales bacterium]